MSNKKYIIFLFNFLVKNLYSVLLISIPKTGTHLLEKTIINVSDKINWSYYNADILNISPTLYDISLNNLDASLNLDKNHFLYGHLNYKESYEKILLDKKIIIFFNIRDPRDQAVSHAYWQKDLPESFPHAITMKFNNVLTDLIKDIDNYYNFWLSWMNYPYALTVRFEDLVGSKGGGDDAQQLATVKAIAKHVSVELSEQRAQEIAANLFGDNTRFTFRKGQIGAWKHEFTQEHKELFKQYGGELLIKLGYEKDLNW